MFKKSMFIVGVLLVLATMLVSLMPAAPAQAQGEGPVVPFLESWQKSGHNNVKGEQFRHWDDAAANPDGVPTSCAKCHTSDGFVDFLADGKVDKPVPAAQAQGVVCTACHNAATANLTSVTFPSGKVVNTSADGEAVCMSCHQGRESKISIDKKVEQFKATDMDAVVQPIPAVDKDGKAILDKDGKPTTVKFGFINVHYFAAGGTLYGAEAQMGYEYEGKVYDPKFRHVTSADTCTECHDQHATEVRVELCAECHEGVKKVEDLQKVRMMGSLMDYDGDGNVKEGMAEELAGLQKLLLAEIQKYAKAKGGAEIVYDGATYPYFMGADRKSVV